MELTFVHQYSGDSPKRKRLAKACEQCRNSPITSHGVSLPLSTHADILSEKYLSYHGDVRAWRLTAYYQKRCIHYAESAISKDAAGQNSDPTRDKHAATPPQPSDSTYGSSLSNGGTTTHRARPSSGSSGAKFVSDMNPESLLLNRPVPAKDNSRRQPNDDIGVWVDRQEWDALLAQRGDAALLRRDSRQIHRPHSSVIQPLIEIYFEKIQPILPLLDEVEFRQSHASDAAPEPLLHAICLVAAKDSDAAPYLVLSESSETISPRQFCSGLHSSITAALRTRHRIEKVTLMRILALTSLHAEGPEGAEEASIMLSEALHYGQTLGIHLGSQVAAPIDSELMMKRLFWCLWALDRLNAATNGRPITMSDLDIAIEPFAPGESQYPAFEAWLRVAQLLNQIIDFYRPTNDTSSTGWEGDYPGLEEIIDEVGGWELSPSIMATIHLFYLSVGILSHRTRGFREIPRGISSSVRQRLCAIEIVRMMDSPHSPKLHPLPVVPYAVSLALSVSYQHLRQSQLEHQQADARQDYRKCCKILQSLRRTWSSADVMATLAKKVLDQLDRAPSLASFRIPRTYRQAQGQAADNPAPDLIPPPSACTFDVGASQVETSKDTPNRDDAAAGSDVAQVLPSEQPAGGFNLFDNMDDVFGTFMDPNYPLNFEDMSFMDDISPFDWRAEL